MAGFFNQVERSLNYIEYAYYSLRIGFLTKPWHATFNALTFSFFASSFISAFALASPSWMPFVAIHLFSTAFMMMSLLIDASLATKDETTQTLCTVAQRGYTGLIQKAIDFNVDLKTHVENKQWGDLDPLRGLSPFHAAVTAGQYKSAQAMLDAGVVDVNDYTDTQELKRVDTKVIERVFNNNFHHDPYRTQFHIIRHNIYGKIQSQTALHLACEKGDLEMIALLIKHGANPKLKDYNNKRPYDLLATNHKRIIRIQAQLDTPENATDAQTELCRNNGLTCLSWQRFVGETPAKQYPQRQRNPVNYFRPSTK